MHDPCTKIKRKKAFLTVSFMEMSAPFFSSRSMDSICPYSAASWAGVAWM